MGAVTAALGLFLALATVVVLARVLGVSVETCVFCGRDVARLVEVAVRVGLIHVELHHQHLLLADHQAAHIFFPADELL